MPEYQKGWFVVNPDGRLYYKSGATEEKAIERFVEGMQVRWEAAKSQGYACRQFALVPVVAGATT